MSHWPYDRDWQKEPVLELDFTEILRGIPGLHEIVCCYLCGHLLQKPQPGSVAFCENCQEYRDEVYSRQCPLCGENGQVHLGRPTRLVFEPAWGHIKEAAGLAWCAVCGELALYTLAAPGHNRSLYLTITGRERRVRDVAKLLLVSRS